MGILAALGVLVVIVALASSLMTSVVANRRSTSFGIQRGQAFAAAEAGIAEAAEQATLEMLDSTQVSTMLPGLPDIAYTVTVVPRRDSEGRLLFEFLSEGRHGSAQSLVIGTFASDTGRFNLMPGTWRQIDGPASPTAPPPPEGE